MKIQITLEIDHEKTWPEICGGNMKLVINHHLHKLQQDLQKHCNATLEQRWYVSQESDCSKCVFNINNENDWIEHCKGDKAVLEECAFTSSQVNMSMLADWIWHKNCPHYHPCKKFMENNTRDDDEKLKAALK